MGEWFKKCLTFILAANFLCMPALALQFDTTIDDDIRKNYNPSKIEKDLALPALPRVLNSSSTKSKQSNNSVVPFKSRVEEITPAEAKARLEKINSKANLSKIDKDSYAVLKQGTKIDVKLVGRISDRTRKGTKVVFVSKYPVTTTYFTIPMGTRFIGEIEDSHKPQLSGNGGLISINIYSLCLRDEMQPLDAYVVKANSKKIFFNNIKGKRKYLKNMFKSLKPGVNFFGKMLIVSGNLAQDGSSIIITPFSLGAGLFAVTGNAVVAPIIALFSKGGSLSIKDGSEFVIKLNQDLYIYN